MLLGIPWGQELNHGLFSVGIGNTTLTIGSEISNNIFQSFRRRTVLWKITALDEVDKKGRTCIFAGSKKGNFLE
jgi:hypothetical protein